MSKLFLHLLNISITAGWIVLVVVLLRFVLKKAPKWIRVVLWGLVALRLMLPVSIESVTSLVPSAETVKIESVTAPVLTSVNEHNGVSYFYENVLGEQIVLQSGFSALNSAVNPTPAKAAEHFDTVAVLKTVAGWVWLAGVCGMLLYALISFLRLRHRVRASVLLEKGVYVCDEISDPFILGLIVPKIYLPSGMDEQTRAYVLSHERAHLRRFDFIWKPLGFFLLSVYWFNPLLWLAYILLCRDIELACDEKVVKELDDAGKAAYSEALVHASVSRRMVSACPLAFGETGVKGRVKSVLNYKKPAFWIILVAILACIAVAVCFLTMPKKDKTPEEAALPTAVPETVWGSDAKVLQWLDYHNDFEGFSWDSTKDITVAAFPGVTFRWTAGSVEAVENGKTRKLFSGMPVWNVFFADVTGDGAPELCASVYFGSGIVDEHIVVYDYVNKQSYVLWDRMQFDFHLYTVDGALYVGKTPYMGDKQVDSGTIVRQGAALFCRFQSDGTMTPLMKELHESELYGEWLVEEERDGSDKLLYTRSLDLWKEYDFRDDGTVTYNETVPYSSDYEKAFGHPVSYPYAVCDGNVHIGSLDEGNYYGRGYLDETGKLHLVIEVGTNEYVYATLKRMAFIALDGVTFTALRNRCPEYFDLPTDKGLEIYVWQMAEDDYSFGLMAGTNLRKEDEQLWNLKGVNLDELFLILTTYDISPENIEVIPIHMPYSSYWYEIDDAYTARVREMLLGEDAAEAEILDEATLCTTWKLVEIEAPDGSNGDARGLGLEQYLVFRSDGTVRVIDAKASSDRVVSYSVNDNTVQFDGRVFEYDPESNELFSVDPSTQDILFYVPAPNAILTEENADTLSALREKYPEFFDLPTENGLTVYVYQMTPKDYRFGLLPGTQRQDNRDMSYLCKVTLSEMQLILRTLSYSPDAVEIRAVQNDLSNYRIDDAEMAEIQSLLFGLEFKE